MVSHRTKEKRQMMKNNSLFSENLKEAVMLRFHVLKKKKKNPIETHFGHL